MLNIKKLNKATLLVKSGDFDTAEKIYSELLKESPNDETVLSFWGMFNLKKGLFNKAEKILEASYKIRKIPSTIASLAFTKYKLGKFDDAIILYEELFRYDKHSEHIYQKIIECFSNLGMYNFAIAYCQKYLISHPDNRHALSLITINLMRNGDYKQAEEYCAKTLSLYPDNSSAWVNAGLLQELMYNNEEVAQECYKKAIEYGDTQAYYHLAVSYQKIGKYFEAEKNYKKAIELNSNDIDSKTSLGMLYLSQRQFNEGYSLFVKRAKSPELSYLKNLYSGGEKYYDKNKVILVYSDQGLGDGIQFARYLPYLTEKFAKVIVYTREPLVDILSKSYPQIEFITSNLSDIFHDCSVFIGDLPYYLDMDFDNIPLSQGYLEANNEKVDEYKNKYFNHSKLKVGLCWKAGDTGIRAAIHRTINIGYFDSLLGLKNIEFYSFQKDDIFDAISKYPQIVDLSSTFKTFEDTAAAMKNLDLMISVDTSCIHLAGALGVKSVLLLPYCSDWRWFDNTKATEWYTSVEIVKQTERQDWFKEIEFIKEYVNNL